jgi:hypothetical protein
MYSVIKHIPLKIAARKSKNEYYKYNTVGIDFYHKLLVITPP